MAERASQADHEEEGEELGQSKDTNTCADQHRDSVTAGESPHVESIEDQQRPSQPEEEARECPGCQSMGILTLPCGHKLCPTCMELSQGELGQAGCTVCYGSQLMDSVLHALLEALFHGQPRRPGVTPGAAEERVRGAEDQGKVMGGCGSEEKEELCVEHGEMLSLSLTLPAVSDGRVLLHTGGCPGHKDQDTNCTDLLGCAAPTCVKGTPHLLYTGRSVYLSQDVLLRNC